MGSLIDIRMPLLRSPPFPWVPAAVAAVSRWQPAQAAKPGSVAAADREALFKAIREAQVGGAFWAAPSRQAVDSGVLLVAPSSTPQARAMADTGERPLFLGDVRVRGAAAGLRGAYDPWPLLRRAREVRADADHELAALAMIAGVPVRLHGQGRFGTAGAGVDPDAVARHLLVEISYRDPFTGAAVSAAEAVSLLGQWRRWIDANRTIVVAAGIAPWKRRTIGRFLWAPRATPLRFATAGACRLARRSGGGIAAWPSRVPPALVEEAVAAGVPLSRIEDGFVRSVGLGSALHQPWSIVIDRRGIYYDPTRPSDLERLLAECDFPPALIVRARALRTLIVERGISKYGAGAPLPPLPPRLSGTRLVLVPGQVSDDLSVVRGGGAIGAEALLARVRMLEPKAEIWFRPHPDVDAGFRRGGIDDHVALRHADRVVRGGSMAALLDMVDGVHVLTSLTGFEALLRHRDVTVHGAPFYAGWGLTRDVAPIAGRGRSRSLDELVAATLILYPRYLDPVTGLPCPAEVLTARLAEGLPSEASWLTRLRAVQGQITRHLQRLRA